MPKTKLLWRFRKGSLSDPIEVRDCGCKVYVYDGTIVRYCDNHNPVKAPSSEGEGKGR
jgi:hypothetical protein